MLWGDWGLYKIIQGIFMFLSFTTRKKLLSILLLSFITTKIIQIVLRSFQVFEENRVDMKRIPTILAF